MHEFKNFSLLRRYLKKEKFNYLAIVNTSWHLLGALACMHSLNLKNEEVSPIIIFSSLNNKYYISKKEEEYCISNGINVFYCAEGRRDKIDIIRDIFGLNSPQRDDIIYIAFPKHFNVDLCDLSDRTVNISLDEGIGTYLNTWIEYDLHECRGDFFRMLYRIGFKYPMSRIREKMLYRQGRIKEFFILDRKSLKVIDSIKKFYQISIFEQRNYYDIGELYEYHKDILFDTDPLIEEGYIEANSYLRFLSDLNKSFKNVGMSIVLKPHPRESNTSVYTVIDNCFVDEANQSLNQELLLAQDSIPRILVGFFSTTMVTCGILYNLKSISLCKILMLYCNSEKILMSIKKLEKNFGNFVTFPDSFSQLEKDILKFSNP